MLYNIKPKYFKGESEFGMHVLVFITQHNLATEEIWLPQGLAIE
jgi:hypothetical protein